MSQASGGGTARIGATIVIPEILKRFHVDPDDVIAEAGLDPKLFDDPDNMVSFAARSRLLELCVARTGCQHFGLLVGQRIGLPSLGLVGYLIMHSPDVGSALRSFIRFFHLHTQGAMVSLTQQDNLAFLGYNIHQPRVEAAVQLEDGAVAIAFNILHKLCGSDWEPSEVCFAHRKPRDLEPFQQFFKAPLRFDAEQNGLFFNAKWLQQTVQEADPELFRLLRKQVDQLESGYKDDFPEQVRRVLRTGLFTGRANADRVAALFSMHSRTLNRHLKAANTSFQQLIDESRYEAACQMLENTEMGVSQIAEVLDYADASSFARAFRRWSGTTPARWRMEHRVRLSVSS